MLLMGDASQGPILAWVILLHGFMLATPVALVPVILLDIAAPRSLGPLFGLLFFTQTVGAAIGPVIVGRMFDVSGGHIARYSLSATIFFGPARFLLRSVPTSSVSPPPAPPL